MVKFLIAYGADPQESCGLPLLTAIHRDVYDIVYYLVHDLKVYIHSNNELPLIYICTADREFTENREKITELLLQHGAYVIINNNFILKETAKKKRWDICALLIRYGADYHVLTNEQKEGVDLACMIRNLDI